MRPEQYRVDDLIHLLRQRKIATIDELKEALGTSAAATVFRKLGEVDYRTSYSHNSRFYALSETARFDEMGLWSFRQVWFSRWGTLLVTVEALVGDSAAGHDAAELEAILHVSPKQPLLALVRQGRLDRQEVAGRYVYLSPQAATRRSQLSARQVHDAQAAALGTGIGIRVLPDELKAAIVLFYSLLDERQRRLYAGLEAMKMGHGGDTQIAELLSIDPGTVAKGRKELVSGEVAADRVRRAGGGRPAVSKKSRRSSRGSTS